LIINLNKKKKKKKKKEKNWLKNELLNYINIINIYIHKTLNDNFYPHGVIINERKELEVILSYKLIT